MSNAIQAESLLRQLDAVWMELGGTEGVEAGGVLRACSMTLIVAAPAGDGPQTLGETLAMLMREHPSRLVLLHLDDAPGAELQARAHAQCWMPFGKRQQICCEQIEISTPPGRFAEIPPVVGALRAPDLPVALYAGDPRILSLPDFPALRALATKVIVNSCERDGAAPAAAQVIALKAECPLAADLAWTMAGRWREAVAAAFADAGARVRASDIEEIRFTYAGGHAPLALYYLAAWFENAFERRPRIELECAESGGRARLVGLRLSGKGLDIYFRLLDERRVESRFGGRAVTHAFAPPGEFELLREELSLLGRDQVYDDVVRALPGVLTRLAR